MHINLTRKTITLFNGHVFKDHQETFIFPKNYLTLCSVYFVTLHFRVTVTTAYTEKF